ncbi:5215_t:CDS:2 [Acaulospora colombiana]|uniref:5215_t:CDS:1 n=1 Tax=Acaulospora colombiana TaxID=27376 RepID=A0ACA9KVZ5_9GLOM|nr:5215_t:CDS:2 [Acaulospora colombiana]
MALGDNYRNAHPTSNLKAVNPSHSSYEILDPSNTATLDHIVEMNMFDLTLNTLPGFAIQNLIYSVQNHPLKLKDMMAQYLSLITLASALLYSSNRVAMAHQDLSTRADLQTCLNGLNVTLPDDPTFQSESQSLNARVSFAPAAIVHPSVKSLLLSLSTFLISVLLFHNRNSVQDVEKVVKCGASSGVPVVGRSGGHSYAGFGLGGVDGALVCDLSHMKNITLVGDNAVVQTGNLLGEVATYLWENGQKALPHGTCPKVGTGGHTSYGGFGPFSRMHGLLLDRVVSAEVVLANGTTVTASQSSNPDLLWALKGAGPSFGIVTSWTYATVPAPPTAVAYDIDLPYFLTPESLASTFNKFQSFVRTAPKELAMSFSMGAYANGVILGGFFQGNYFGTKAEFEALVNPFIESVQGTVRDANEYADWTKVLVHNAYNESLVTATPYPQSTFFTKSYVAVDTLSDAAVANWTTYLVNKAARSDVNWFIQVDRYGGAVADFNTSTSSFKHRDAFLVFQCSGSSTNNTAYPSDGIDVTHAPVDPNYIDPTLTLQEWQSQYFGDNMPRLIGIKALYDPNNVFSFPQSIPVQESANSTTNSQSSSPPSFTYSSSLIQALVGIQYIHLIHYTVCDSGELNVVVNKGDKVEDVEEEELLQSIVTPDASNASALGLVDQRNDLVTLRFEFDRPNTVSNVNADHKTSESPGKHKRRGLKSNSKPQRVPQAKKTVIEIDLAQDITALRSRTGDTGRWLICTDRYSILFAWKVLQQLYTNDPGGLFDPISLKSASVLELGGGTGLLGLLLAPHVQRYICTDLPELIPLIKKNISINNKALSGSEGPLLAEPLNWVDVYECPPNSRHRLFSRNLYIQSEDISVDGNSNSGADLVLAVDCVYNPALVPPLLTTIDLFASPGRTVVLVVMELRDEDVVRDFLVKWTEMPDWEIWRIGNENHRSHLDARFAIWVGKKTINS